MEKKEEKVCDKKKLPKEAVVLSFVVVFVFGGNQPIRSFKKWRL
jgi:hypothetical protein